MFEKSSALRVGVNTLHQRWENSGPQATCGPPQRFQWPIETFRKIYKSEISSNSSVNVSAEANLNRDLFLLLLEGAFYISLHLMCINTRPVEAD